MAPPQSPSSKFEEDPILAKALDRTNMGSCEGQKQVLPPLSQDTSDTASQTLGNEDSYSTEGVQQNAQADPTSTQVVKKKSFATLFEKNRLPTTGSKLEYYNLEEGPIQLGEEGYARIRLALGKVSCGIFWKEVPRETGFEPDCHFVESPSHHPFPWNWLRNVPLTLWNPMIFGKICSKLGRPIHTDRLTTRKEIITYAICLVEVDIAKELVHSISLNLSDEGVHEQGVYYEKFPSYYLQCKKVGHNKENCNAKQAANKIDGGQTPTANLGKQPTTKEVGENTRGHMEWVIKQNTSTKGKSSTEELVGYSAMVETAIQEPSYNPESTPVNLESEPILAQPPPELTIPQNPIQIQIIR
ncbi:hypothetical protein Acr_23g0007100 [Actinidia rufa]|uniref:DUF4283 domain-containing protein n=1 Tax=Actinidia rufa TaxID=165716 RepID=A0A7J0GNF8_9ERIC|nr:hypothetical protein Acr_23g0007100 [Actinidia rufa]